MLEGASSVSTVSAALRLGTDWLLGWPLHGTAELNG